MEVAKAAEAMGEVMAAQASGRLVEMFGSGTAAVVSNILANAM